MAEARSNHNLSCKAKVFRHKADLLTVANAPTRWRSLSEGAFGAYRGGYKQDGDTGASGKKGFFP
jgi:hypothetical protein